MEKNATHDAQRTPGQLDIQVKISSALLEHSYRLLRLGQLTSLFCATIILLGLYEPYQSNQMLFAWYVFYIGIALLRILLFKMYTKQKSLGIKLWKILFIIGALLGGLSWGIAGSVLFIHANYIQQILLILVLAGVTAGAAPLLAADRLAAITFITSALVPPILILYFTHANAAYSLFALGALGYYFYLIVLCIQLHRLIKESLGLKFENDILLEDVSAAKNQLVIINKKLVHAATHDPLTNLANRSLFEFNLKKAIERAKRTQNILALLYIDLDNFKEINDAYGHHAGDELLLHLITRISTHTRKGDTVARLGGDELAIILEDINDYEMLRNTAKRLCNVLATPVAIQGHMIVVTASIGISIFPIDGTDIETLLKNADKAMYYVKEHGRNSFHFCSIPIVPQDARF